MNDILVSIVMPVFNTVDYLDKTIESVVNQSHREFELLLVDDCSSDGSYERCTSWARQDKRIRVLRNKENYGAAISRNKGISKCDGKYIAFLDSDDIWDERKLEYQISFMEDHRSNFSFTGYLVVDGNGKNMGSVDTTHTCTIFDYTDMLKKRATMGCSTVMVRRKEVGNLRMPNIRTGQDYAFWLLLLRSNLIADLLPKALTKYRVRRGSISRNKIKKAARQWQIYRELEKLPIFTASYYFSYYALRAIFRKR